jgi:microcompartment protein CcmL/EutN
MLLLGDIPPGLFVLDTLAKEAEVEVLQTGTIHCGRYLILFAGEVGPVERAWRRALDTAGRDVVDEVLLPHAEARLLPAIARGDPLPPRRHARRPQAATPPALVRAVDAALPGARSWISWNARRGQHRRKGHRQPLGRTHDMVVAFGLARASFEGRRQGAATAVIPGPTRPSGRLSAPRARFFRSSGDELGRSSAPSWRP